MNFVRLVLSNNFGVRIYMQQIPTSVMEAINSRTRAILASRKPIPEEISNAMGSNELQLENEVSVSA